MGEIGSTGFPFRQQQFLTIRSKKWSLTERRANKIKPLAKNICNTSIISCSSNNFWSSKAKIFNFHFIHFSQQTIHSCKITMRNTITQPLHVCEPMFWETL
jgi:hypothetical protein